MNWDFGIELWAWIAMVLAYWAARIGEMRMDRINTRYLLLAGAAEAVPRLTAVYYRLVLVMLPFAAYEYRTLRPEVSPPIMTAAVTLVLAGGLLRYWAIRSLGWQWTMRCLIHPAAPLQDKGPYRWARHPEYLSRLLDGAGMCAFLGAYWTALGYVAVSLLLLWPIMRVERQLLLESAASLTLEGSQKVR